MKMEEKIEKFREWLESTIYDWNSDGMTEEVVGLESAKQKFEELFDE